MERASSSKPRKRGESKKAKKSPKQAAGTETDDVPMQIEEAKKEEAETEMVSEAPPAPHLPQPDPTPEVEKPSEQPSFQIEESEATKKLKEL